ncbi:MAG TPA: response regulator [Rhodanobacteraceae bacterium]|nr:response regulator [Rhodanobacteraceae bacterium]
MSSPVLIVEDEPDLAHLAADYLRAAGYEVEMCADGAAALESLRRAPPRLVVLDLMIPSLDGLALCREIRTFSNLPIVMTTAKVQEIDRLLGLETGADDYLCKPYSPRELVARVKAVLRRSGTATPSLLTFDDAAMRVQANGRPLTLTATEYALLAAMARRPGTIFSRARLLDLMRENNLETSDRAVDSHIKNLRRKLAAVLPDVEAIQSVYGVGYRLEI